MIELSDGSVIQTGPGFRQIGTAGRGQYLVWKGMDAKGRPVFRCTKASDGTYPEGNAGYRDMDAMLRLKNITFDGYSPMNRWPTPDDF